MREKWMMNGSRKNARERNNGRDKKSRHRIPGNGHTKETYERDGTEMSVMRTRCERFRPGKVESRKPKDPQLRTKNDPKMESFFCGANGNRTSDKWTGDSVAGLVMTFPDSQSVYKIMFWVTSDGCVPSSCRLLFCVYSPLRIMRTGVFARATL